MIEMIKENRKIVDCISCSDINLVFKLLLDIRVLFVLLIFFLVYTLLSVIFFWSPISLWEKVCPPFAYRKNFAPLCLRTKNVIPPPLEKNSGPLS